MTGRQRRLVLGIGNLLNRDEGLGVHALRALADRLPHDAGVELVDGGALGLNLLPLVESCSHLLVLDAIDAGAEPGTLIELVGEDIPLFTGVKMSQHQVSFQEVLGLASFRGHLPEHLVLLGAQPADISIGVEPSAPVAAAVEAIVARALVIAGEWTATRTATRDA